MKFLTQFLLPKVLSVLRRFFFQWRYFAPISAPDVEFFCVAWLHTFSLSHLILSRRVSQERLTLLTGNEQKKTDKCICVEEWREHLSEHTCFAGEKMIIINSKRVYRIFLWSNGSSHVMTQTHVFEGAVLTSSVCLFRFSHDAKTLANTSATLHYTACLFPLNFT